MGGFAPGCAGAFAAGGEAFSWGDDVFADAGLPPGDPAGADCAGDEAAAGDGGVGGFAPGCAGAFAAGGEAFSWGDDAFAGAGLPPGDPAGAGCAGAASSSAGAALPMFAKSGPSLTFPIIAGRSKM